MAYARRLVVLSIALSSMFLLVGSRAGAMPNADPIQFESPTPDEGSIARFNPILVRLSAACTVDPGTLAVDFSGTPLDPNDFLPFGSCVNGRMLSKTVSVNTTFPSNTQITSGPSSVSAGDSASFNATAANADAVLWNFDGAAEPVTAFSANPTIAPAGTFTVRARGVTNETLDASALDNAQLVTAQRNFNGGDLEPDSQQLVSTIDPDLDFWNFESSHVHPIALSNDSLKLFAVNTNENRLEAFDVAPDGSLTHSTSTPVGMDPVSLAVRPASTEVWVANNLSDSVTIVDGATGDVLETLVVGDEPTDIAFASGRAFVSLSGQFDRVGVYNAATRANITNLDVFGDDPRALAVSNDGTEVYLVVLESGNQTTILFEPLVTQNGGLPAPSPPRDPGLGQEHDVGLIVQFDGANWRDETGTNWSNEVDFDMPDDDVFIIDADAGTPSITGTVTTVGTTLFDVAARPGSSDLFVVNTDSRNLVRFEPNLRGHLVETRISVVDPGAQSVSTVDLNPHINYAVTPGSGSEIADSLSQPGDGVFTSDGSTFYLTAFGSGKVAEIDADTGAVVDRIAVSGGGPSGVALNEGAGRLYVMNRFTNTISLVSTSSNTEVDSIGVAGPSAFDPSPDVIKAGRKFLYDATLTSGHGDIACATCHTFSNFDNLAWDLGDPTGDFLDYDDAPWVNFAPLGPSTNGFDPQKGPMTTQSLRGLNNTTPFHWRGDRENFGSFNPAFVGLMGTASQLSTPDMDAYTDFINTVHYPPNPYQLIDGSFQTSIPVPNQNGNGTSNASAAAGSTNFFNNVDGGVFSCNLCHTLPTGTSRNLFDGGLEGETQDFKIPQLRNMYEKVGFDVIRNGALSGNASNSGPSSMKAGFGFLHDGGVSLTEFLAAGVFNMNNSAERDMFAFMLSVETETPPAVGRTQVVDSGNKNDAGVIATISTLVSEAELGRCDVIAKGEIGGVKVSYLYSTLFNVWVPDSTLDSNLNEAALRASIGAGDFLVYTGVPDGTGIRLGFDRDRDTHRDRDEILAGTDPADPNDNLWKWVRP